MSARPVRTCIRWMNFQCVRRCIGMLSLALPCDVQNLAVAFHTGTIGMVSPGDFTRLMAVVTSVIFLETALTGSLRFTDRWRWSGIVIHGETEVCILGWTW